jgi:hypothetical protein
MGCIEKKWENLSSEAYSVSFNGRGIVEFVDRKRVKVVNESSRDVKAKKSQPSKADAMFRFLERYKIKKHATLCGVFSIFFRLSCLHSGLLDLISGRLNHPLIEAPNESGGF